MKRKALSLMFATAVVAATLAGCGSSASTDSSAAASSSSDSSSAQSSSTEVAAPTGDAFANLPDTIKGNPIKATPEMYANTDLSKPYTVNMYLIGDTHWIR